MKDRETVVKDCSGDQWTAAEIRNTMSQIARRQWWLWATGIIVVLLLAVGIVSFANSVPLLNSKPFQIDLNAIRGLVGIVLIFSIYVSYEQLRIHRIQTAVECQIGNLGVLQRNAMQLYRPAGRDALTNLYNQSFGEQRLMEEIIRAKRNSKPLAVLRARIDGLEKIEESLGRAVAEHTIQVFANHLRDKVRGSDVPVTLGLGEFLILLPECQDGNVLTVLHRINSLRLKVAGQEQVSIVAGFVMYRDGDVYDKLLLKAEASLNHSASVNGDGRSIVPMDFEIRSNEILAQLRPREIEVFELLVQGKSNKDVAKSLKISVRTVETYRAKIMALIGVHSASELVLFAVRNKLFGLGS